MKRILKKVGKYLLITFIGLFITINAFILLSGRLYLYKGIANTYLVGKSKPTIYDLDVFEYSTIKASSKTKWKKHKDFIKNHSLSSLFIEHRQPATSQPASRPPSHLQNPPPDGLSEGIH